MTETPNSAGRHNVFASFRDPAGYLYFQDGVLKRTVRHSYKDAFDAATEQGLFSELIEEGKLIPFDESPVEDSDSDVYRELTPKIVPFISYPFEWCFSQLKDAALLTIDIQIKALQKGMILKDASAYNVQFFGGRPVFIDHLSFDLLEKHVAWPAYAQFCKHFLSPLALMSRVDVRFNKLTSRFIDGIPLDFAASALPKKNYLNFGLLVHLLLHSRHQAKYASKSGNEELPKLNADRMLAIASSLRNTITSLKLKDLKTEWGEYYSCTNYSDEAMSSKKSIVTQFVDKVSPHSIWDLGGNTGVMSHALAREEREIVCFDIDESAVEQNYAFCKKENIGNVLPLVMDFTNPSPGLGFASKERDSLSGRGPADLVMALALIHHLSISNNVPFVLLAEYLAGLGKHCVIEFIPKEDSQTQRLLATREDVFPQYDIDNFESVFSQHFEIQCKEQVQGSKRHLYLLKSKRI